MVQRLAAKAKIPCSTHFNGVCDLVIALGHDIHLRVYEQMCRCDLRTRLPGMVDSSSKVVYNTMAHGGRKCSSMVAVAAARRATAVLGQL